MPPLEPEPPQDHPSNPPLVVPSRTPGIWQQIRTHAWAAVKRWQALLLVLAGLTGTTVQSVTQSSLDWTLVGGVVLVLLLVLACMAWHEAEVANVRRGDEFISYYNRASNRGYIDYGPSGHGFGPGFGGPGNGGNGGPFGGGGGGGGAGGGGGGGGGHYGPGGNGGSVYN